MTELTLKQKLQRRLPNLPEAHIDVIESIVNDYNIELTIRNLDRFGLILTDALNKSVRISFADWRNGKAHIPTPHSDIAIVVFDSAVAGWVRSDKLEHLADRSILDLKFLSAMPETFSFMEECSHLEDHGGFSDGEFWVCFGCDRKLIFTD